MKKILIIVLIIGGLLVSGCVEFKDISDKEAATDNKEDATKIETVDNLFFFDKAVSQLNYNGEFLFDDIIEENVKMNINELANLKYGKLYELKLDPIHGISNDRLSLGYFYVQKDKIYKIEMTEENLSKLKTDEVLPKDSVIVCQNQEIKDTLGKDEPGFHHYLEVIGDKRVYHSYNNQASTGYYESFTWEKGKGLSNYRSGFGAERDSIELELINN